MLVVTKPNVYVHLFDFLRISYVVDDEIDPWNLTRSLFNCHAVNAQTAIEKLNGYLSE